MSYKHDRDRLFFTSSTPPCLLHAQGDMLPHCRLSHLHILSRPQPWVTTGHLAVADACHLKVAGLNMPFERHRPHAGEQAVAPLMSSSERARCTTPATSAVRKMLRSPLAHSLPPFERSSVPASTQKHLLERSNGARKCDRGDRVNFCTAGEHSVPRMRGPHQQSDPARWVLC